MLQLLVFLVKHIRIKSVDFIFGLNIIGINQLNDKFWFLWSVL